jgi:hypothetical protein
MAVALRIFNLLVLVVGVRLDMPVLVVKAAMSEILMDVLVLAAEAAVVLQRLLDLAKAAEAVAV